MLLQTLLITLITLNASSYYPSLAFLSTHKHCPFFTSFYHPHLPSLCTPKHCQFFTSFFTTPTFLPCVHINTVHLLLHFTTPRFLPCVHPKTVNSHFILLPPKPPSPIYLHHPLPPTLTFNEPHLLTMQRSTPTSGTRRG